MVDPGDRVVQRRIVLGSGVLAHQPLLAKAERAGVAVAAGRAGAIVKDFGVVCSGKRACGQRISPCAIGQLQPRASDCGIRFAEGIARIQC